MVIWTYTEYRTHSISYCFCYLCYYCYCCTCLMLLLRLLLLPRVIFYSFRNWQTESGIAFEFILSCYYRLLTLYNSRIPKGYKHLNAHPHTDHCALIGISVGTHLPNHTTGLAHHVDLAMKPFTLALPCVQRHLIFLEALSPSFELNDFTHWITGAEPGWIRYLCVLAKLQPWFADISTNSPSTVSSGLRSWTRVQFSLSIGRRRGGQGWTALLQDRRALLRHQRHVIGERHHSHMIWHVDNEVGHRLTRALVQPNPALIEVTGNESLQGFGLDSWRSSAILSCTVRRGQVVALLTTLVTSKICDKFLIDKLAIYEFVRRVVVYLFLGV